MADELSDLSYLFNEGKGQGVLFVVWLVIMDECTPGDAHDSHTIDQANIIRDNVIFIIVRSLSSIGWWKFAWSIHDSASLTH